MIARSRDYSSAKRMHDEDHRAILRGDCSLRVTGHASHYLLVCEALSCTKERYAITVFERLFKERGLPTNIRGDNGVPC